VGVSLAPDLLVAFLLATVRASAWLLVTPPFSTRGVPAQVRVGLAAALSLPVAPRLAEHPVSLQAGPLVAAAVLQVAVGLALGFVALLLFSAVQAAGELIDLFGGFSASQALDPLSGVSASVFGRLYELLTAVLLFAIDGHLLLLRGFLTSFDAVGLQGAALGDLSEFLTRGLGQFFLAALEIAGPLVGALFLADVALGLLARAAPQLNLLSLGFPLKIMMTLLLGGFALPLLPPAVSALLRHVLEEGTGVVRAFT
jgi:flagellar biosynthetic protein FliR